MYIRFVKISVSVIALVLLLNSTCLPAAETGEDFPKIAFVKNNGSNVRAGDNVNFEILCNMRPGDPVKILDKRYSWFKIELPRKAHLYIKNDYVDLNEKTGVGALNTTSVNLRAGPGTKYSILGQASEPDELKVISESSGWYKIEPPEGTTGWIHASQVSFTLADIEPVEVKDEIAAAVEEEWVADEEVWVEEEPAIEEVPAREKILAEEKSHTSLKLKREPPQKKGNLTFSTQN